MTGFSSLSQMVLALRGRWKLATATGLAMVALIIAVCAMLPPRYTAIAWVVFNNRGSDPVADKNDNLGFSAYVNGEVDLIGSRRVFQKVASDPALLADPRTLGQQQRHQKGRAPLQDWLIDFVGNNTTITSVKGVRTVSIGASFDDPKWAKTVANKIAKAYLETAVDLKTAPARQNVAFFRQQKSERAVDLTVAQARLDAFLRETGMTGLEATSDSDEVQLRTLAERLTLAQADQAGSAAQSGLGGIDTAVAAGKISSPVIQQLRSEITGQSAALRDMTVLSGPNYPAVAQARERLAELKSQLGAELGKVADGVRRDTVAAGRERTQIAALAAQKRQFMSGTAANRSRLKVLTGDVARAQASYDAVAARLGDAELQSAVQSPNAAILSPATVPRGPSFPKWPLIFVLALAAGAVTGVIVALVKELLVPRVRSPIDLQALLGGAPVLCDLGA